MPFLYRTAVIVSRKPPYIDWADSLREGADDGFPEELAQKRDVYLGPYSELQQTLDEALADVWPEIFEEELFAWSTDESRWPANRTRDMFDEWFATELVDSIVDLVPEDPLTEDDMDVVEVQETMSRSSRASATASRRSVFTLSPGLFGMSDGATTWQAKPLLVKYRYRPYPQGPASYANVNAEPFPCNRRIN